MTITFSILSEIAYKTDYIWMNDVLYSGGVDTDDILMIMGTQ
jgi:hypothetical protein